MKTLFYTFSVIFMFLVCLFAEALTFPEIMVPALLFATVIMVLFSMKKDYTDCLAKKHFEDLEKQKEVEEFMQLVEFLKMRRIHP